MPWAGIRNFSPVGHPAVGLSHKRPRHRWGHNHALEPLRTPNEHCEPTGAEPDYQGQCPQYTEGHQMAWHIINVLGRAIAWVSSYGPISLLVALNHPNERHQIDTTPRAPSCTNPVMTGPARIEIRGWRALG